MNRTLIVTSVLVSAFAFGCTDEGAPGEELGLTLDETKSGVAGRFVGEHGTIAFRNQVTNQGASFDMEFELRGMVVTITSDRDLGVIEIDAFAAADGGDTQILAADRALFNELAGTLDLGRDTSVAAEMVRSMAAVIGELPNSTPMPYLVVGDNEKSASLCGALNTYRANKHDGWSESYGADNTTIDNGYVSTHGPCRVGDSDEGNAQCTWWSDGGAWNCLGTEPNHSTTIEWAYGDCLGRCGKGCTTTNKYTVDCWEHDGCNRFGHSWSASLPGGHCADEMTGATWDATWATSCW